jgi:dienelactone hydrolase
MPARTRPVRVADGEFDLHLWFPERGHGPGILVIPEIFGVGTYIRAVAADLASLGYVLAARAEPAVLLSFYGSAVPENLGLLDEIHCPVQFHFGGQDPYIPRDKVAAVEEAAAGRPGVEIHVQEAAGHAFHNFDAPRFHHPEAGRAAWRLAMDFLARNLPAS